MRRSAIVLLSFLAIACPRVDFSKLQFPPDASDLDGGAPGDASVDAEAEPADAEDTAMRCIQNGESWWCYAALAEELEVFAAAHQLDVTDIEVEPGNLARRYAAVLIPKDGLYRHAIFSMRREIGVDGGFVFPEQFLGTAPAQLEPTEVEEDWSNRAGVLFSRGYSCSVFVHATDPTTAALRTRIADDPGVQQVRDINRQIIRGVEQMLYVANSGEISTVEVGIAAENVRAFDEDGEHFVRAMHVNADQTYDVSIGSKKAGGAASRFVHGMTEEGLARAAMEMHAEVTNLEIFRNGGARRFSAVLTASSTAAEEKRRESARLAAILQGSSSATVALYAKKAGDEGDLFFNERAIFPAKNLLGTMIAVFAYNDDNFDDAVTLTVPADACGTSTVGTSETLASAFRAMMSEQDARRATALVAYFGLPNLQAFLPRLSMTGSTLAVPPGCEMIGSASTTTLLDQALLYEHGVYCAIASVRQKVVDRLPGAPTTPDGEQLRDALDTLIEADAPLFGFDATKIGRYEGQSSVVYASSDLDEDARGIVHRAIVGRLIVPRCEVNVVQKDIVFFGMMIDGPAASAGAEAALDAVKIELLRRYFEPALRRGPACY